ncbi:MAG: hypothetical protein GXY33_21500 [Phycisphaerae bacterium]|nr:hypothetical protein [Phycisphaerae bacterium]
MVIRLACPLCDEPIEVDVAELDEPLVCPECGEEFELPEEYRDRLERERYNDDLGTIDFLADGQIDGDFWPFF